MIYIFIYNIGVYGIHVNDIMNVVFMMLSVKAKILPTLLCHYTRHELFMINPPQVFHRPTSQSRLIQLDHSCFRPTGRFVIIQCQSGNQWRCQGRQLVTCTSSRSNLNLHCLQKSLIAFGSERLNMSPQECWHLYSLRLLTTLWQQKKQFLCLPQCFQLCPIIMYLTFLNRNFSYFCRILSEFVCHQVVVCGKAFKQLVTNIEHDSYILILVYR